MLKKAILIGLSVSSLLLSSCASTEPTRTRFTGAAGEVRLITLDPGHFHAALVQKTMYAQVSPVVSVYAPPGPDVEDHLARIERFNRRDEDPTRWVEHTYVGHDFLHRMLRERPGNVVVISGENRHKARYINACVRAGLNVLADKPMCIDGPGCRLIDQSFDTAQRNGVLLYDIMTERSEITTILQKELINDPTVFGTLITGSVDEPAVVKESVHHFFKYVAGSPIKRPPWYFDTTRQGEGIVDVTTHLVDLVMWECFPGRIIDFERDVEMKRARRWPTMITRRQYEKVTRLPDFPQYLQDELDDDGVLPCYANGEMNFTVNGIHARVSVGWEFQAPEGAGDTHFSVIRGTRADVIIRQSAAQGYRPELYVEPAGNTGTDVLGPALEAAIAGLRSRYPGIDLQRTEAGWHVIIPDELRVGHEAHFHQVMERYLRSLVEGGLPAWEVPNMKTKYRITTAALELARR
ncbi:MAG: putative oxidoreductase C-terminal domain-containing protein [Planctomycetota bacterium]|nr:putative oxidoreductase C-terminal domain-containing protein [Planctomycetota bacterium]